MATITVTNDTNFSSLNIADNDILTLTSSARLTFDESTDVDLRTIQCITDGEFFCENLSNTPRFITVGGSTTSNQRIRLESGGRMVLRGQGISIGTSDGTANQSFTLPTDGSVTYQLLAGLFLEMPTPDLLRDGTPVPRLMARVDSFADTFGHERLGALFVHDVVANTITLGDGVNGWIPPSGAELFVPSIQIQCTNTASTKPFFDLSLSGRMDFEWVSVGGNEGHGDNGFFNPDFDNGAGQRWDHVVIESRSNNPVNFNVNAGAVELSNVVTHCSKEMIVSAASVPPVVRNFMLYSRYTASTDYQVECFNNTGGTFENIVVLAPHMSNGNTGRGAWAGSSSNVDIYNLWAASPNPAIYFVSGASNCRAENVYAIANGRRGFVPATKTAVVRATVSSNILFINVAKAIPGEVSHQEALLLTTSSRDVTLIDSVYDAGGDMDHIVNDTSTNTRLNNVTIQGQLANRIAELGTASNGLKLSNVKFESTQTNNSASEVGFGTQFDQTMVKGMLSTAVGTGTDTVSHHTFINEDDTVGRFEMRMSPVLKETDYYTPIIQTGKVVFNQNNRMYIENAGDQVVLTSRVHYGINDFTGTSKAGSTTGNFDVRVSLRRPDGAWSAWSTLTTANASSALAGLPADPQGRVQVRFEITKTVSNLTNYLTAVVLVTDVDNTVTFPFILEPSTLTLTDLKPDTEVRVFEAGGPLELAGAELATGTFVYDFDASTAGQVDIVIHALGHQNLIVENVDLSSGDVTLPIQQQIDRQYANV